MMRSSYVLFGLFAVGALAAVAATQTQPVDPRESAIRGYRQWHLVTPQAVYMEPALYSLCAVQPQYDHTNPHSPTYFRVYVNPIGKRAMFVKPGSKSIADQKDRVFPVGSVIVKEKFQPVGPASIRGEKKPPKSFDSPDLLTVMIKREAGFDRKNGDWEYFTASGDRKPNPKSLSVKHCQSCHLSEKAKDYTFRTYVSGNRPSFPSHQALLLQHPQR